MCTRNLSAAVLTFAVSVVAARFCFAEGVWADKVKETVEAAEKYNYKVRNRLSSELENGGAPAAKAILIHLRQGSPASVRLLVPILLRMKDPTAVRGLQELLRGNSAGARRSVIHTLFSSAKTDARLLPFWRKALDNDVPYVVLVAAAACREHGDESGLEKMLGALTTTLSTEAVECLKKHKFEREDLILAWLLKCLAAPNNGTPMQVAVAHHDERVISALLKLAGRESKYRGNALNALGLIGDAKTLEPLISIMNAERTKESIKPVTRFGNAQAVEALLDLLVRREVQNSEWLSDYVHDRLVELTGQWIKPNQPDVWRKWWAANKKSFTELVNSPEAKRAWELLPSLEDPKAKAQAAEDLIKLGPAAAPALARKLMDIEIVYGKRWESGAKIEAAKILTKLGNTGIEYLFSAVTQGHQSTLWHVLVQAEPVKAFEFAGSDPEQYSYFIGTASRPEQGPVVRKVMQQMKAKSTWGFLIKTLVKAEGAGSAQLPADLARDKQAHKKIRLTAYTELQKLNPKLAVSIVDKDFAAEFSGDIKDLRVIAQSARTAGAIGELADDKNRTDVARVAAAIVLLEGKHPGAAEKLRTFLHSKDLDARLAAINAIGRTDPASAVKELIEIASAGPDPDCRVAAIEALGASRRPEALPVLMKLLHESDSAEHAVDALDVFSGLDYARENRLEEATKLYDAWAEKIGTLAAQGKDAAGEAVTQAVRNAAKVNPAPFPASLQPMLLFVYAQLDFEFKDADRSSVTFPIATQACCFSADGAKAAFSWFPSPTGRSIVIMDMKTRQARALPSDAYAVALAFSPDASSLAELCVKGNAYDSSVLLRVIPIDAPRPKTLVKLHDSNDHGLPPYTCSIVWLDNRRLLLRTVDNDGMKIELIDAINGTRSKLFNSEQIAARWPSLPMPRGDDLEPLTFLDRLSISGKGEVWFWK